jgi:phenylacetate-CoA ligase
LPTSCAGCAGINSRAALARMPVTRKSELLERQKAKRQHDPFGGFLGAGARPGHVAHLRQPRPDLRTRGRQQ